MADPGGRPPKKFFFAKIIFMQKKSWIRAPRPIRETNRTIGPRKKKNFFLGPDPGGSPRRTVASHRGGGGDHFLAPINLMAKTHQNLAWEVFLSTFDFQFDD